MVVKGILEFTVPATSRKTLLMRIIKDRPAVGSSLGGLP